jgi:hypothetical protein
MLTQESKETASGILVVISSVKLNYFEKYKAIIFSVVLYGCETWSLTVREEHRLRAFGNALSLCSSLTVRDQVEGVWEQGAGKDIRTNEG